MVAGYRPVQLPFHPTFVSGEHRRKLRPGLHLRNGLLRHTTLCDPTPPNGPRWRKTSKIGTINTSCTDARNASKVHLTVSSAIQGYMYRAASISKLRFRRIPKFNSRPGVTGLGLAKIVDYRKGKSADIMLSGVFSARLPQSRFGGLGPVDIDAEIIIP